MNNIIIERKVNNFSIIQLVNHLTVRRVAFTLAEVLITLAIIGVVAGLTIPSLLANTNEKGLNTSDSVFQRRLGEALKIMNLQGTLAGQPSTEAFVTELGRHMKITKVCNGETNGTPLTDCFVSEFQSGNETINTTDLKASKNLYSTTDYGTKTVGVVFGNGTRALIAYNPNATQDQFNNSNENGSPVRLTTSGSGKQTFVSLDSDALSILYILQERKNNNVYEKNIKGINISFGISKCAVEGAKEYGGKCYLLGSGTMEWYDAHLFCLGKGMSLTEDVELVTLMQDSAFKSALEIPSDTFWSDTMFEDGKGISRVYYVDSSSGSRHDTDLFDEQYRALCAGN